MSWRNSLRGFAFRGLQLAGLVGVGAIVTVAVGAARGTLGADTIDQIALAVGSISAWLTWRAVGRLLFPRATAQTRSNTVRSGHVIRPTAARSQIGGLGLAFASYTVAVSETRRVAGRARLSPFETVPTDATASNLNILFVGRADEAA